MCAGCLHQLTAVVRLTFFCRQRLDTFVIECPESAIDLGSTHRIWQDLIEEYGVSAKYQNVRWYVARQQQKTPQHERRIEACCQRRSPNAFRHGSVDYEADSKRWRSWVFRIVLSHSRKPYSGAVSQAPNDIRSIHWRTRKLIPVLWGNAEDAHHRQPQN